MRVYVSSTYKDLADKHRPAVIRAVQRLRHEPVNMENYVADPQPPLAKCLADVRSCHLYVGLFAWRYGFQPPGEACSITELEYREAVKHRIPVLIFLLKSDYPWNPEHFDDGKRGERAIDRLRADLELTQTVSYFTDPSSLAEVVAAAIANLRQEVSLAPPTATLHGPLVAPSLTQCLLDWLSPRVHRFLARRGNLGLALPPELPHLDQYLRELHAAVKAEIQEKIYIPVSAEPVRRAPAIHQTILQLAGQAQGGDSASAQIAAANRRSRVVNNLLRTLFRSPDPLMLLGDPGSGKSLTLQEAVRRLARRERHKVFPRIPIYLRLGEFHVPEGSVTISHVRDQVQRILPEALRRLFDALEDDGRLIVFFDGMDEMSRDRYGEHTEALSRFADSTKSKTLFSCRITDFSPRFLHRRLVLLPFGKAQVREYLSKYIQAFPVEIGGRAWGLRALTDEATQGELAAEANNPFVLWLLCLYVQERKQWPSSRVELMTYYQEQNFARKEEEGKRAGVAFPPAAETFAVLGRIALQITELNRGSSIAVVQLAHEDAALVEKVIDVGRRCGVLDVTGEGPDRLVRFKHHRFQEYFTARCIHQDRIAVDWLAKLDAPRWQETMLNLILMSEAPDVVDAFADAIQQPVRASLSATGTADTSELVGAEPLVAERETLLADRVELASRILKRGGAASTAVHNRLVPPVEEAVSLLVERGNPITQVKMMRACQNLPALDVVAAMRKPLNSPIAWVRDQALILIGSSQTSGASLGSDLATELGYDLAKGRFFSRFGVYWKAARGGRGGKQLRPFVAACLAVSLHFALLFAVVAGLYFGVRSLETANHVQPPNLDLSWTLRDVAAWTYCDRDAWFPEPDPPSTPKEPVVHDFSPTGVLREPWAIVILLLVVFVAACVALCFAPEKLWALVLGGAVACVMLMPMLVALWAGSGKCLLLILLGLVLPGLCALTGAAVLIAHLGVYLVLAGPSQPARPPWKSFFTVGWAHGGFRDTAVLLGGTLLTAAAIAILLPLFLCILGGVFLFVLVPICQVVSDLSHLPFHPGLNAVLVLTSLGGLAAVAYYGWRVVARSAWDRRRSIAYGLTYIAMWATIIFGGGALIKLLNLEHWWEQLLNWVATYLLPILVIVLILLFGLTLTWVSWLVLKQVVEDIRKGRKWRLNPGSMSPEDWKRQFGTLDAKDQHWLMLRADHRTLSLTPQQYLDLLREVAPDLHGEPAASHYWELRDRLEQVLKLERGG